jgi:hypothetical protein
VADVTSRRLRRPAARGIIAALVPLTGLPPLAACAGLPHYRSAMGGEAANPSAVARCKRQAQDSAERSKIDALPPDPPAEAGLGSYIGSAIGQSIVLRRRYKNCMERLGYVRQRS